MIIKQKFHRRATDADDEDKIYEIIRKSMTDIRIQGFMANKIDLPQKFASYHSELIGRLKQHGLKISIYNYQGENDIYVIAERETKHPVYIVQIKLS